MLNRSDVKRAERICRLLQGAASKDLVQEFLRQKRLRFSAGTWEDLINKRIVPYLHEGALTIADLRALLRQFEESGRQHVFLFQCEPERARRILGRKRIDQLLSELGFADLLQSPLDLELPEAPSLVEIRRKSYDGAPHFRRILIKQVETRENRVFLRTEIDRAANEERKIYQLERKRAVNFAILSDDGLLEMRIASRDNSTLYRDNIQAFARALSGVIPVSDFKVVSLQPAKDKIWQEREQLKGRIRFANSEARNDYGNLLSLSVSAQSDSLSDDDGSNAAMGSFLENDAHITKNNVYFVIPDSDPQREVHVLLSGEVNEFAVTAACTAEDYSYVRGQILQFNQSLPG